MAAAGRACLSRPAAANQGTAGAGAVSREKAMPGFDETVDWEERYRRGETPWERGALHPAFTAWERAGAFAGIRSVLVPLAGRAPEPLAFARLGIRPTLVDLSATALAEQRRRFEEAGLQAAFIEADILAMPLSGPWDAIWDQAAMCALPPRHWEPYVARLAAWLKPGGRLFALFMQTDGREGPPFHQDVAQMRLLFPAPLWQWPDEGAGRFPHPAGLEELAFMLTRA